MTSQKYPTREDNRREVMRIVEALVEEGKRKFPTVASEPTKGTYVQRRFPKKPIVEDASIQNEVLELFKMIDIDNDGVLSFRDWKLFFEK